MCKICKNSNELLKKSYQDNVIQLTYHMVPR